MGFMMEGVCCDSDEATGLHELIGSSLGFLHTSPKVHFPCHLSWPS